jgi:hypothetical protein
MVVSKFLDSLNLIEALAQMANPRCAAVRINKHILAHSVINRTLDMASSLACYAAMKADEMLSAKVALSPGMISRSWDPVISSTAHTIYDLADKLTHARDPEAAQCGITQERNQLLLNAIVAFAAASGSEEPPCAPSSVPYSLEAELRMAEEILDKGIAPLMTAFKSQRDAFFDNYRKARELAEALPEILLHA